MRRRLQFSVRSLLILTTLSAVLCAFGVPAAKRYLEERERRARIVKFRDMYCGGGVLPCIWSPPRPPREAQWREMTGKTSEKVENNSTPAALAGLFRARVECQV